jgi:F0F1-type ATP synthase assembly protein I
MENTDNTLREMQQQMQQLREKLNKEQIINERLLQTSCRQTVDRLKFKSNLPIVFAIVAILCSPAYLSFGLSPWFLILTCVLMLVSIVATILTNRHIPQMDKDLVTATNELTRYKKIHAEWLKYSIPALIVWVGCLIWDFLRNQTISKVEFYGFIAGISTGLILGILLGLKVRRDQLNAADELISQIEELQKDA